MRHLLEFFLGKPAQWVLYQTIKMLLQGKRLVLIQVI